MAVPSWLATMLEPRTYRDHPSRVGLVQTQMSYIFLAGEFVYKVKKAVNLGYLDYTTLEARCYFCQRELELNRRLCPDVYLAVLPITRNEDQVYLDGKGPIVEYTVKMRRLPRERILDHLLQRGQATPEMMTQVAQTLAEFHSRAETSPAISEFGTLQAIKVNTEENFTQTAPYIGRTISPTEWSNIRDYTNRFLEDNSTLLARRVTSCRIRDCHGDLHTAHICFRATGICIFDCIEFNDRFRYCDVASEIAFLAMDLDSYEHPDLSNRFVQDYINLSQDQDIARLLNFYKCYRAFVRGKVGGFKYDDPHISAVEKAEALATARRYFSLAQSYALKGGGDGPLHCCQDER
jgi:aminoglycoside phosphotransferase family enzyme